MEQIQLTFLLKRANYQDCPLKNNWLIVDLCDTQDRCSRKKPQGRHSRERGNP